MRNVEVSEFETKCLRFLDQVAASGEPLVITRQGEPIVELVPAHPPASRNKSLFGLHAGKARILGDIISPLDEPWEADEDHPQPGSTLEP